MPGGEIHKGERSREGEGGITHTPVNVLIDSCHMSIPAWLPGWLAGCMVRVCGERFGDQQRAAEGFRAAPRRWVKQAHRWYSSGSTCHLTNVHSTLTLDLIYNNLRSLRCLFLNLSERAATARLCFPSTLPIFPQLQQGGSEVWTAGHW